MMDITCRVRPRHACNLRDKCSTVVGTDVNFFLVARAYDGRAQQTTPHRRWLVSTPPKMLFYVPSYLTVSTVPLASTCR